jgi:hypothetical protein
MGNDEGTMREVGCFEYAANEIDEVVNVGIRFGRTVLW